MHIENFIQEIPADILPPAKRPVAHDFSRNPCKMPEHGQGKDAIFCNDVTTACMRLRELAGSNTRIVIFGSFYTVAEAMQAFSSIDKNNGVNH